MTFKTILESAPEAIQAKFVELALMRERPDFHPEPSAKHHIEIVTNRAIEWGDKDIIMAAFFHDIHKVDTMKINPKTGWPTSPGHDKWAMKTIEKDSVVRDFIKSFGADPDIVGGICGQHMRMHQITRMRPSKQQQIIDLSFFSRLAVFACFDDMMVTDAESQENASLVLKKIQNNAYVPEGKYEKKR